MPEGAVIKEKLSEKTDWMVRYGDESGYLLKVVDNEVGIDVLRCVVAEQWKFGKEEMEEVDIDEAMTEMTDIDGTYEWIPILNDNDTDYFQLCPLRDIKFTINKEHNTITKLT